MRKKEQLIKFISYAVILGYIIGMLFLVSFLKKQAKIGAVDTLLAEAIFDTFVFSVGMCILYIMPFSIHQNLGRVTLISYFIFALFLGLAVYVKHYTASGEVIGDLLYVFSGAMLYQGISCTVKFIKIRRKNMEDNK